MQAIKQNTGKRQSTAGILFLQKNGTGKCPSRSVWFFTKL